MIVLDTHAWFFWVNDNSEELSEAALRAIQFNKTLGVSIISCWEMAMLVAKERLKLSIDIQLWIDRALQYPGVKLLNISPEIAVLSTRLPGLFYGDPADRMIAATCLYHGADLVTKDKKIQKWGYVPVAW